MNTKWLIAALAFLFGVTACAAPLRREKLQAGTTLECRLETIRYNGFGRTYRLHIPRNYTADYDHPLVIVIHGAFSTAREIEQTSGFSRLADREGFIVLYPNGIGIMGYLQHWNAGHCCGKAAAENVNDTGFIWAAVEDAAHHLSIDMSRVYVVGFSNGGMLTHRLGAQASQSFAAIAPMAAAIGGKASPNAPEWQITTPQTPLPVIIFHGLKDEKIPYSGGPIGGEPGKREYTPVSEAVTFWTEHNRCRNPGRRHTRFDGAVEITAWQDCTGKAEVQLYTFKGVGHEWPAVMQADSYNPQESYDTAEVIWNFFKRFRNTPSP